MADTGKEMQHSKSLDELMAEYGISANSNGMPAPDDFDDYLMELSFSD